jgi:hypothetical protein
VFVSNRITIAGLVCLALAMCGCLLLVTTNLFGAGWGTLITVLASVPFLVLWFAMPIRRAVALGREQQRGGGSGARAAPATRARRARRRA